MATRAPKLNARANAKILKKTAKNAKLRIALVITGLHSGGSESQIVRLATGLAIKHEVIVISLLQGGVHKDTLRRAGVRVKQLQSMNPVSLLNQIRRELRLFQPDIVHAWLWHASILCRFACIRLSIPVVSAMRGQEPTRLRYYVERLTRPLVAQYTANSEYIAKYYGLTSTNVAIIPNGVPKSIWEESYGPRTTKTAIAVSRLVPEKDLTTLLNAMALVPDWKLDIISTGPREKELRALASELKLNNVQFVGYVTDVPKRVAQATCMVHLAFEESSPNAVIEALLLGTPVIASDIPALRELLDKRGTLIPNGAAHLVAKALRELGSSDTKRVKTINQKTRDAAIWAQERFELSTMISMHESIYCAVRTRQNK